MSTARWGRAAMIATAAALLPGATAPAAPTPLTAPPLVLRYEAYAVGLPVVSFDFHLDETVRDYRVGGEIRSNGLLRLFYRFAMGTSSEGSIAASGLTPRVHETVSRARGEERLAHLDFHADGSIATALSPPEDPGRPRPTAQQIAHSMDPLTAILAIGHFVAEQGRCGGRFAIYDGRRRYDLVLSEDGPGAEEPPRGVAGPVRRCAVAAIKLAGFSFDQDYSPHTSHGRVWLAPPVAGAPALPVRIEFGSSWGAVTVRMTAVNPGP